MNNLYYIPTYTNVRTLNKVPEEVIKMFGVEADSKITSMIPEEVVIKAAEINQQRQQAINIRNYLEKKGVDKSSFI